MKYENIEKFAKRVGVTPRTIYRFYNKYPELKEETKKKGKRLYPIEHKKYWKSELLFENNVKLVKDNREVKKLIDYLYDNENPLATKYWYMKWSLFVSIDYKHERNKSYCFTMMSHLYRRIESEFGNDTTIRMFFVTEPFANRNNGHHNHIVIYLGKESLKSWVLKLIKSFFSNDRVDSSDYNKYKGGLFYMMKNGIQGEDWDILGNNLAIEGMQYENKGYKKAI